MDGRSSCIAFATGEADMRSLCLSAFLFLGLSGAFTIPTSAYALDFSYYSVGSTIYKKYGTLGDHDELVILQIDGRRAFVKNIDKGYATEWVSADDVIGPLERAKKNYDDVKEVYDGVKDVWKTLFGDNKDTKK